VLYIGWARGLERFVVVDHGGSIYTVYGNIDRLLINEGDQLVRGEQFAVTTGARLHFEVRDGKDAVDPLTWLRKMTSQPMPASPQPLVRAGWRSFTLKENCRLRCCLSARRE